ncbi:MAG TPA: 4'-phosphopantetheinyl transferase superfamily protein [Pyrinomonadaceae bacterium]|jgi:4'-phosphopantetheinyl transferase
MIAELIRNPKVNIESENTLWLTPPSGLKLDANTIDVWLVPLELNNTSELKHIISDDEKARAERFRHETDKTRYITARAFLRIILGKYLQINPRRICFGYNKYGKPSISGDIPTNIKFNLSHSENLSLVAVTEIGEIGVDIERVKKSFVDLQMAMQFLTRREIKHFQTLSGAERDLFFFDCWTQKEAFLKACGTGFSLPPNQVEISSLSSEFANYFLADRVNTRQKSWSLQRLPAIVGYAAALAVEGANPRLRFWQRPDVNSNC